MISHRYKAIFVHVPKTGGTSITSWSKIEHGFRTVEWHSPNGTHDNITGEFVNGASWRIKRNLESVWDDYFKFGFVRNPWDRTVSCFLNRARAYNDFGVFLDDCPWTNNHNIIWHMLPQLTHLCDLDGKLLVNTVYKFEEIELAIKDVEFELNMPHKKLAKHNSSYRKKHYSEYYTSKKQIDLIGELYQEEIEKFGYEFKTKKNDSKKFTINVSGFKKIIEKQIVISRYDETLQWIGRKKIGADLLVYNKGGVQIPTSIRRNIKHTRILQNVGRESHTHLTHIIENYDRLAKITFFTQGSPHLLGKSIEWFLNLDSNEECSRMNIQPNNKCVRHILYKSNENPPKHCKLAFSKRWKTIKSKTNLLSWWCEVLGYAFPLKEQCKFSYHGTFSVTREYIRKYPKSYYIKIIKTLSHSIAPEEGHFMERAWSTIFNPNKNLTHPPLKHKNRLLILCDGGEFAIRLPENYKNSDVLFSKLRKTQLLMYDTLKQNKLQGNFKIPIYIGSSNRNNKFHINNFVLLETNEVRDMIIKLIQS